MNAEQIRYSSIDSDVLRNNSDIRGAFIADMLQEIAAHLAEVNRLTRLRLALEYQESLARMPDSLCAAIEAAIKGD